MRWRIAANLLPPFTGPMIDEWMSVGGLADGPDIIPGPGDNLGAVRRSVHDAEQFDSRRSVSRNRDRRVASVTVVIGNVDLVRRAAAAHGVRADLQSRDKGSIGSDLVVAPSAPQHRYR